jgi:hypothetical protein
LSEFIKVNLGLSSGFAALSEFIKVNLGLPSGFAARKLICLEGYFMLFPWH